MIFHDGSAQSLYIVGKENKIAKTEIERRQEKCKEYLRIHIHVEGEREGGYCIVWTVQILVGGKFLICPPRSLGGSYQK
jgi:hypothetical protein